MKSLILIVTFLLMLPNSHASSFGFNNLDQGDVDNIFKEFSASFTHSTVSGAASKSKIFGFEAGVVAGVTQSKYVKELVADAMPAGTDEVNYLPFASVYGLVSLPLGITVEANFMPEFELQDVEFKHLSLAGKIELTTFFEFPVDVAIRAMLIDTSISIQQSSQSAGGFAGQVDYNQTQMGIQAILGKKLTLIEPYISLGLLRASGDIDAVGTGSIFTVGKSFSSSASSLQLALGLQVDLLLARLGVEYVNSFGASHVNAKFALSF